jgi:hypothetical protein
VTWRKAGNDDAKALVGLADCLFALCRLLEIKGLLTRAELAELLTEAREAIIAQEGGVNGRVAVADFLIRAFQMPVAGEDARSRWQVLDGGADHSLL